MDTKYDRGLSIKWLYSLKDDAEEALHKGFVMPIYDRRKLKYCVLLCLMNWSVCAMASTTYLECALTSVTTNTAGVEVSSLERDGVILEILNTEGALEFRTHSVSIPIDLRMNPNKKEWRSGEAAVYDENMSSSRRYSVQRIVEDQISTTRTSLELDRATGYLIQETTQELGEGMAVINITQGKCAPSKRSFNTLF